MNSIEFSLKKGSLPQRAIRDGRRAIIDGRASCKSCGKPIHRPDGAMLLGQTLECAFMIADATECMKLFMLCEDCANKAREYFAGMRGGE